MTPDTPEVPTDAGGLPQVPLDELCGNVPADTGAHPDITCPADYHSGPEVPAVQTEPVQPVEVPEPEDTSAAESPSASDLPADEAHQPDMPPATKHEDGWVEAPTPDDLGDAESRNARLQELTDETGMPISAIDLKPGPWGGSSLGERLEEAYTTAQDWDADTMMDFFGVTPEQVADFRAKIADPDVGAELDEARNIHKMVGAYREAEGDKNREGVLETAPSLLEARIPEDQEAQLEAGGYVLGSNPTPISDANVALDHLERSGGIDVTDSSLGSKFIFVDGDTANQRPDYVDHAVVNKNYKPDEWRGRFIAAVPHNGQLDDHGYPADMLPDMLNSLDELPPDYFVERDGRRLVNARYIAGFTDGEGRYHRNPGFMQ